MSGTLPRFRSAQAAAGVALVLLALSSLNSKIAGTLWGLTFIGTAILAARQRPWPVADTLDQIARVWLVATALGLTLWIVSAAIWNELYPQYSSEINAGIRLVTGALAAYWLTRVVRFRRSATGSLAITVALSVASLVALVVAQLAHEREQLPSHAIAWAAAMGLIITLLVARAADSTESARSRVVAALGVLCGAIAILGSQSRGVYPVIVWCVAVLLVSWYRRSVNRARVLIVSALSGLAIVIGLAIAIAHPADPLRMREAVTSVQQVRDTQQYNTPTGARVYLFTLAWQTFKESPWIGVGAQNRLARIHGSGLGESEAKAAALWHVRDMGHVHNAYLHHGMDGGVISLFGFLLPLGALAMMAVRLRPHYPASALQMWGILFVHAVSNLTSVNLAHNYYALMLVISVALVLVQARLAGPVEPSPR